MSAPVLRFPVERLPLPGGEAMITWVSIEGQPFAAPRIADINGTEVFAPAEPVSSAYVQAARFASPPQPQRKT